MFAFDTHEEERGRLARLQNDDPIALQDAFATSESFLAACKAGDLAECKSIVENAQEGDFLQ